MLKKIAAASMSLLIYLILLTLLICLTSENITLSDILGYIWWSLLLSVPFTYIYGIVVSFVIDSIIKWFGKYRMFSSGLLHVIAGILPGIWKVLHDGNNDFTVSILASGGVIALVFYGSQFTLKKKIMIRLFAYGSLVILLILFTLPDLIN